VEHIGGQLYLGNLQFLCNKSLGHPYVFDQYSSDCYISLHA